MSELDYTKFTSEELQQLLLKKESEAAMLHTKQMGLKVALNSAYGALGNQYFLFFDVNLAESVTTTGQLIIRWIENALNEYMNKVCNTKNITYVIYCDTDSNFLCLDNLIEKVGLSKETNKSKVIDFLNNACEKINEFIDEKYTELAAYINAYQQTIRMGRDCIADCGFWTAKKKYALNVWDSEGTRYIEPHMKIMGLETVRSSTPAICRDALKQAIKLILTTDENTILDFIEDFRKKYYSYEVEEISFPRGVNDVEKYSDKASIFIKGTPGHTKGCILYNHWIKEKGLDKKYELIRNGDKIKFVYLLMPNTIRNKVIAYPTELPKELGLHSCIDYDTMFDKSFMEPLKNILNIIQWKHKKQSTLEGLFV